MNLRDARKTAAALTSDTLIAALNTLFPNSLPMDPMDAFQHGVLVGQRRMIDFLGTVAREGTKRGGSQTAGFGSADLMAGLEAAGKVTRTSACEMPEVLTEGTEGDAADEVMDDGPMEPLVVAARGPVIVARLPAEADRRQPASSELAGRRGDRPRTSDR